MRRARTLRHALHGALIGALLAGLAVASPAAAASKYPTWEEVEQARGNEAAQREQVTQIDALISELDAELAAAQEAAVAAQERYQDAYALAAAAEEQLTELQLDLESARTTAQQSRGEASNYISQLSRTGAVDASMRAMAVPEETTDVLYQLGAMTRMADASTRVVDRAVLDANAVSSLEDQSEVVAQELADRRAAAEVEFQAAEEASAAAQQAVAAQEEARITLAAQLAVLEETTAGVEQQYEEGERERARLAAIEAERQRAAAAAAAAARPSTGGNVGTPTPSGANGTYFSPSPQGWYRPAPGPKTSDYGPRRIICNSNGCSVPFHAGVDLGDPCGRPLKAAFNGVVTFTGHVSGFGNRVIMDMGDGVEVIYGHIQNGSFQVR
ncbi:MAG: M23 family metallopeptidase, partial [Microbacteriaceae bacterium]